MTTLLVADDDTSLWGHIFHGQREQMTRFVYDMESDLLLAVQIQTGPIEGWRDASPDELLDVAADIDTNRPYADPEGWDLAVVEAVPTWAADLVEKARAAFDALCDEAARQEALVPGAPMDYEEWLDWSGLDDSFVGDLQRGIPGTRDKYDGAARLVPASSAPAP